MSEGKNEWYVSRGGQRFGPVTFEEMVESARAGRLQPRTDMVIGGDQSEWKPAGDVDGLFEKNESAAGDVMLEGDPSGHTPPSNAMADSGSFDFNRGQEQTLKLPGATRLGFFLGVTVLPVLLFIGLGKLIPEVQGMLDKKFHDWVELLALLVPLITIVITVKRFQNLAMTGWWWFGLIVPFLNLWLYYRLFACPPGYAYTKKLDLIGKLLAVLYWLTPVALIVAGVMLAGKFEELNESGKLEEFLNKIEQQIPDLPKIPTSEEPEGGS